MALGECITLQPLGVISTWSIHFRHSLKGFWLSAEVMCHTWADRRGDIAFTSHLCWDCPQIWESAHEGWFSCRGLAFFRTSFVSASQSLFFSSNPTILPNHNSFSFSFTLLVLTPLSRLLSNSLDHLDSFSLFPGTESPGSFIYCCKGGESPLYPIRKDHPSWEVQNYFIFTRCFYMYHSVLAITSYCTVITKYFGKSFTLNILLRQESILCYQWKENVSAMLHASHPLLPFFSPGNAQIHDRHMGQSTYIIIVVLEFWIIKKLSVNETILKSRGFGMR